jgi:hypothetical protein
MSSARKFISETRALKMLDEIRAKFRANVLPYEMQAKPCSKCDTPGSCCVDAHFVNVRVSRHEARQIVDVINDMPPVERQSVFNRIDNAIDEYGLDRDSDNAAFTYACPLFDTSRGCLVHDRAKPLPCIHHACYERREDLPPDHLLAEQQGLIEALNLKTYGRSEPWLPIPVAIRRLRPMS